MPTYSYKHLDDGTTFEVYQSFTEPDLTVSPTDGRPVRKVFSPIGVSFSGSGFYRNDSRSENKTSDAAGKKAAPAESSSTPAAATAAPAAAPAAASTPSPSAPSAKPAA
ncbi:MAG: FmdB family transcriptional regulator [Microbacteriaceae bacterium]|nr:FmdB family transcriptional regulator [Microbacteriaceae bacterium]